MPDNSSRPGLAVKSADSGSKNDMMALLTIVAGPCALATEHRGQPRPPVGVLYDQRTRDPISERYAEDVEWLESGESTATRA